MNKRLKKLIKFERGMPSSERELATVSIEEAFDFYPAELLDFVEKEKMVIYVGEDAPIQMKLYCIMLAATLKKNTFEYKKLLVKKQLSSLDDVDGCFVMGRFNFHTPWRIRKEKKAAFVFIRPQSNPAGYKELLSHEIGHLYDYYLHKEYPLIKSNRDYCSAGLLKHSETWHELYHGELTDIICNNYADTTAAVEYFTSSAEEMTATLFSILYLHENQLMELEEREVQLLNRFRTFFFSTLRKPNADISLL